MSKNDLAQSFGLNMVLDTLTYMASDKCH